MAVEDRKPGFLMYGGTNHLQASGSIRREERDISLADNPTTNTKKETAARAVVDHIYSSEKYRYQSQQQQQREQLEWKHNPKQIRQNINVNGFHIPESSNIYRIRNPRNNHLYRN